MRCRPDRFRRTSRRAGRGDADARAWLNASANLAFLIGRWFGRQAVLDHATENLRRWDDKLEKNALAAPGVHHRGLVLLLSLLFLGLARHLRRREGNSLKESA